MIRRIFLVSLVLVCLLALNIGVVPLRAQYDYQDKVLAIDPDHLIAYWPLNETSGTTAYDVSGNGLDGTYSGVTLNQIAGPGATMGNAGLWDGINDVMDSPTLTFDGQEGTLCVWAKLNAGAWSDSDNADRAIIVQVDNNNRIIIDQGSANNLLQWTYIAGGTSKLVQDTSHSGNTSWNFYCIKWSKSADQLKAYFGGSQIGTTQTGLGTFSGTSGTVKVGAGFSQFFMDGYAGHGMLWNIALADADITTLSDPAGLPTPTPTITFTPSATHSPTPTLEFGTHIILSSGQVGALYYKIDSGAVLLGVLLLIQVGLLLALLALRMWRRA